MGECTSCYMSDKSNAAVATHLQPKYIRFPSWDRPHITMNWLLADHQMHMCVGAVDGSHIPIIAPNLGPKDYRNRTGLAGQNSGLPAMSVNLKR